MPPIHTLDRQKPPYLHFNRPSSPIGATAQKGEGEEECQEELGRRMDRGGGNGFYIFFFLRRTPPLSMNDDNLTSRMMESSVNGAGVASMTSLLNSIDEWFVDLAKRMQKIR